MAALKKALVFYLYGNRNAGDMAICLGSIELLKKQKYEITMVSRFSESEQEYDKSKQYLSEYYPDVKVFPGSFSFERDFSTMKKLRAYISSFLTIAGVIPDHALKELIRNSDAVFFNGGNLLRGASVTDYLRLLALFYPIVIAHNMGKPLYCLPQSTARIGSFVERRLKSYLSRFKKVYIRERISYAEMMSRFPDITFVASTDLAFLCSDTTIATRKYNDLQLNADRKRVAIVVRNTGIGDIGELSFEKQNALLSRVQRFVEEHKDFVFWIVVQTDKDKPFSLRLFHQMNTIVSTHLIENHDPLVLREIYKNMEVLITMRLHAGILALSAATPTIGIFSEEWGLKNPGIMEDYEMPYVMIEKDRQLPLEIPTGSQKTSIVRTIQTKTQSLNW